jgi:hypothetical protein
MSLNDASRIVIDDYRLMLQIVASLTHNSKGVNYGHKMFIVQVTIQMSQLMYDITSFMGRDRHQWLY